MIAPVDQFGSRDRRLLGAGRGHLGNLRDADTRGQGIGRRLTTERSEPMGSTTLVAFIIPELFFATRVSESMIPRSTFPLRVHRAHVDSTSGGGRAMACRPVGLCPPERIERGWSANRGARLTRVSANRLQPDGRAPDIRLRRVSALTTTPPRGMGRWVAA
jgi:hypothetical protein